MDANGPVEPEDPSDEEMHELVFGYKPSESPEEVAKAQLKAGLISSVNTIVHLSEHSSSEKIRLDASKYILEFSLGKPGAAPGGDMWEQLFKDLEANKGGQNTQ